MMADRRRAGPILRWQEPTTECWLNAEDVEDARTGAGAADALCLFAARQRESWRIVRSDTAKDEARRSKSKKSSGAIKCSRPFSRLRDEIETSRSVPGAATAAGARHESRRRRRCSRRPRARAPTTTAAARSGAAGAPRSACPVDFRRRAAARERRAALLSSLRAAKLQSRLPPRIFDGHALLHEIIGVGVDVEPQLFGDAVFETGFAEASRPEQTEASG